MKQSGYNDLLTLQNNNLSLLICLNNLNIFEI